MLRMVRHEEASKFSIARVSTQGISEEMPTPLQEDDDGEGGLSAGGGDGPGMTRVDMARLAEILAGPEEAERLLAASGR